MSISLRNVLTIFVTTDLLNSGLNQSIFLSCCLRWVSQCIFLFRCIHWVSHYILWFNPPFSKSVVTKIVKTFQRLIDKHFPQHHKLHKLFNRNNVKMSYSCTPNVKSIINKHNKTVLDPPTNNWERTCNCINSETCPLQQKCLINNIMYKATITSNQDNYHHKIYYGINETKFKQTYPNHIKSFRHEKHQSETELSNELWSIKNNSYIPNIVWEILQKHHTYYPNIKRCSLCLNEKLKIARYKGQNLPNKRSEIINKCCHQNKFALVFYDSKIEFSFLSQLLNNCA